MTSAPDLTLMALATAFAAGAVSFLSPCVLPLVPGYLAFVAGRELGADQGPSRGFSVRDLAAHGQFVLGFSAVFVVLGLGASVFGGVLVRFKHEAMIVGGVALIVLGAVTTGLVRVPPLERELRFRGPAAARAPGSAWLIGVTFALGWTPCIGPILGAILALAAARPEHGAALLVSYSLGLGVPFIAAALMVERFSRGARTLRHLGVVLRLVAGATMIGMGLLMVSDRMTWVASWIIETFPALVSLGW